MRRLFPLFSALVCLLFWGMLPAQGAAVSWHGADGGKMGEKFSPLPAAELDGESNPGCLDTSEGASDLSAETPETAFPAAPLAVLHRPAQLGDRRAATLVGTVVLLI